MSGNENPLLDFSGLPRFGEVRPDHIVPAIMRSLPRRAPSVERIAQDTSKQHGITVVAPAEATFDLTSTARGARPPSERRRQHAGDPRRVQRRAAEGHRISRRHGAGSPASYARFRCARRCAVVRDLDDARRKVVDNALRDFRLGGADLGDAERRVQGRAGRARALSAKFDDNVLDSENAWTHTSTTRPSSPACPPTSIAAARALRKPQARRLPADAALSLLHAGDAVRRRPRAARADASRRRDARIRARRTPEWDNTPVIARILELRHEEAQLLGYRELRRGVARAEDGAAPARGARFPARSRARARGRSPRRDYGGAARIRAAQSWASRTSQRGTSRTPPKSCRPSAIAFSEQEVKQYFPEDRVLAGLFRVVETLYGVDVEPGQGAGVASDDVRFFEIFDAHGALVGQFYLDLYAREGKRGGAWMDDAINRAVRTDAAADSRSRT